MNADVHALAGAYALDALPAEDSAAFAEHLRACEACRQEVAELQVTAAQLGLAATRPPPGALRDRVLGAVQHTRQVPPSTPPASTSTTRRPLRPRLLAAAAVLALIVGAGIVTVSRTLEDRVGPPPQNQMAAVIGAPDARTTSVSLRGGGAMTVITSHRLHRAVVLNQDLPHIPASRAYQLWLVDPDGNARPARVLISARAATSAGARLVRSMQPGDQIAITREPAGGSRQPSMAPLAMTQPT